MSEARHVTLASTSNAEDAAWLAVADVAAVATDLGIDYRLIGGNSVALLVRVHDAATQVPDRATADADIRVSFEVCADPRLVPALTALGYESQSGNRFMRTQGTRALVIDVLAPSYLGRLISKTSRTETSSSTRYPASWMPCVCRPCMSRPARS